VELGEVEDTTKEDWELAKEAKPPEAVCNAEKRDQGCD
jgi:hypothetical protein